MKITSTEQLSAFLKDVRLDENLSQSEVAKKVGIRQDLINCLVHADYSDRASVKVTKSPQGFYFRNPGLMRVSAEIALNGGESDCRNRILHSMFLLLGLGERVGSGIPKIKQGWIDQGHSLNLYDSQTPYLQTVAELFWVESDNKNVGHMIESKSPSYKKQGSFLPC